MTYLIRLHFIGVRSLFHAVWQGAHQQHLLLAHSSEREIHENLATPPPPTLNRGEQLADFAGFLDSAQAGHIM